MRILTILAFAAMLSGHVLAQTSSWEAMNRGLQHTLVYTIAIDQTDSLLMYCGTDYGRLYKSTDGGFNWVLSNNGIPTIFSTARLSALTIDPGNPNTLYAGFSSGGEGQPLFISTDAAGSWTPVGDPSAWPGGGILHIYRSNGTAPALYAGSGDRNGIYRRKDGSDTWVRVLDALGVQCISGHPANPFVLFAGGATSPALLRSSDEGNHWSPATEGLSGLEGQTGVRSLAHSPSDPSVVFAGVTGPGHGLYKSVDAGLHWKRMNDVDQISEISIHPRNENIMYISAIHTGVLRSLDGGTTWEGINDGLPTTDIMRVRIAPGYPIRVFAMTLKYGIFRMVDEELGEEWLQY
ncbi:hypothetical protein KQI65_10625 [bacterium]|nr:hypothetical protein [bacterium]